MNYRLSHSLLVTILAAFAAGPAIAEKNDWTLSFPETKAHFAKVNMEWAKKDPSSKSTKEEFEALFDKLDADKDGTLTKEEYDKKPKPAAGPVVAEKNDWTLGFPETKAHFAKVNMEWAKKNPNWHPTKEEFEAEFDQLDTNKDGSLSQEEYDKKYKKEGAKKK